MNRIAVITGGSSGIGLAVARELASQYCLILVARNRVALEEAQRSLQADGARVKVVSHDITENLVGLQASLRQKSISFGGNGNIDVLVHSAGVTIEETASPEEEDTCHKINVIGTRNVLHACRNILASNGHVLVFSSLSAFAEIPGISKVYGTTKRTTWKIAEKSRDDFAKKGVSVSIAFPPVVETPMVMKLSRSAPIYRAFPWLSAQETARTALLGMFSRKTSIHFAMMYSILAIVATFAPKAIATGLRYYIPFIVYVKGARTKDRN